ncbi:MULTISPECIES: pentapeptide repeat-containing protein [unclassified Gemella]|uniref:pentapeptide repeat-containing protein n=1 Tax=unclassified Gemella TaxID=2624949 RepID=UPI001C043515|nr:MULTISPECIES: pentapeptide repeat-containing protein [unclassified Gemella]MBU0279282.1 pentapeptide repeat-containing protein [Gemella sp. zg-1178]QWQ39274.1 pentapeptide repeat-containing protein [Gemella sp. zg-570]
MSDFLSECKPCKFMTQASLDVLVVEHEIWLESKGKEGERLVLSSYDFSDFDFSKLFLKQAVFENCDFSYAKFDDVFLAESCFKSCRFDYAKFKGVNLYKACFKDCSFLDNSFNLCVLSFAKFKGVNGFFVSFKDCSLVSCFLDEGKFYFSKFSRCDLKNLGFDSFIFESCDFLHCDFLACDLSKARLWFCHFSDVRGLEFSSFEFASNNGNSHFVFYFFRDCDLVLLGDFQGRLKDFEKAFDDCLEGNFSFLSRGKNPIRLNENHRFLFSSLVSCF